MGWFDDQIEYRKKYERELLNDSFENIARSVTGRRVTGGTLGDRTDVGDAIACLLAYLGIKEREIPAGMTNLRDRLDFLLSSSGVLYREVILTKGWRNDAMGPMIGSLAEEGTPLYEGLSLTFKQMSAVYEKLGVTPIQRLGEKFDPNLENAVMQGTAEEGEPGTVCQVFQKGYRMGDRVLRHALVKVVAE